MILLVDCLFPSLAILQSVHFAGHNPVQARSEVLSQLYEKPSATEPAVPGSAHRPLPPWMRSSRKNCVSVDNSSVAGLIGFGAMGLYTASKHAVAGLTKSAALEFSAQGVRVNAVAPAVIETEMADRFIAKFGGDDFRKQRVAQHPIGRVGRAEEVAQTVVFLASDKSSFISGQIIAVDGAYTAQ